VGQGRLIADQSVSEFVDSSAQMTVRVRSPQAAALAQLISARGGRVQPATEGDLDVLGMDASAVGDLAAANGITLHQLVTQRPSLEDAFMEMTRSSVEYHATPGGQP